MYEVYLAVLNQNKFSPYILRTESVKKLLPHIAAYIQYLLYLSYILHVYRIQYSTQNCIQKCSKHSVMQYTVRALRSRILICRLKT